MADCQQTQIEQRWDVVDANDIPITKNKLGLLTRGVKKFPMVTRDKKKNQKSGHSYFLGHINIYER